MSEIQYLNVLQKFFEDREETLFGASKYDYLEIVRFLVDTGLDISDEEYFAVLSAATAGHVEILRYLLSHGETLTESTVFKLAIENGHLEALKLLLTYADCSLIEWAAIYGQLEILRYLLQVQVNSKDNALENATLSGCFDVVKLLLDSGANPKWNDNGALKEAVMGGHSKIAELLLDSGAHHLYHISG